MAGQLQASLIDTGFLQVEKTLIKRVPIGTIQTLTVKSTDSPELAVAKLNVNRLAFHKGIQAIEMMVATEHVGGILQQVAEKLPLLEISQGGQVFLPRAATTVGGKTIVFEGKFQLAIKGTGGPLIGVINERQSRRAIASNPQLAAAIDLGTFGVTDATLQPDYVASVLAAAFPDPPAVSASSPGGDSRATGKGNAPANALSAGRTRFVPPTRADRAAILKLIPPNAPIDPPVNRVASPARQRSGK